MKRIVLVLVGIGLLLVAVAVAVVLVPPEFVPQGQASARWFEEGPHAVVEEEFETVDCSRDLQAYGDFAGAAERVLRGRIWRPDVDMPVPLIVYSHGFMSSHVEAEYLAQFLATHGYMTVAVDYQLTTGGAPAGPLVTDVINQPGDASFVLDTLLARNRKPDDVLFDRIDPARIAAVGLSLGGLTTELIAFHPDIGDPRIKAAASIAGPTANLTRRFFTHRDLPFLMLAGEADAIVPFEANAAPIVDKAPGAILASLADASHTGFAAQAAGAFRFADHPDEVVCPMLLENLATRGEQALFRDDPATGIVAQSDALPCQTETFERAMRPAEQIAYMRLVIFSFLESVLADDAARRQQAKTFLMDVLPRENEAVSIRSS